MGVVVDVAGIGLGIAGIVVSVWALLRAHGAQRAADEARRLVGRQRLSTSFARMEHAVQMLHLARAHELVPLFTVVVYEWRPIAAEVRGLLLTVGSPKPALLRTLTEVNTLLEIAREEVMSKQPPDITAATADVVRGMLRLGDLLTESRIALEYEMSGS